MFIKPYVKEVRYIKYIKFLIPIFIFFIGCKVNAVGIVYLSCDNNGCVVVNRCDNQYFCQSPLINSNEIQFNFDNASYEIDSTYNFNLNFTTSSPAIYGTPNIYDCNLAINGAFVVATRNSGRTGYECGSDHCDASFVSSMSYTMTQSLSNVPTFIRCQMNTTRYNYTQFTYSSNSNKGSVIKAINDNGNNQIQTANNNAQQNNANRDSNTNRILSGITGIGNTIVEGIVSGINSAKNFILNSLSTINSTLGDVISGISTIGSNIVNGITSAVTSINNKLGEIGTAITNKIGEMIGTQETCDMYYRTSWNRVLYGEPYETGYLNSDGTITSNSNYALSPFLPVETPTKLIIDYNYAYDTLPQYICFYRADESFGGCSKYFESNVSSGDISSAFERTLDSSNQTRFIRYGFRITNRGSNSSVRGNCTTKGLFGLFNNLFNSNVGSANTGFQGFMSDFSNDSYGGVENVVSAPLSFVNNLNNTCQSIHLTLPHTEQSFDIPCLRAYISGISNSSEWQTLLTIVTVTINGLLCYKCLANLFTFFHELKDPHNDDLEVLDL